MLELKSGRICPHSIRCPYSENCQGINPSRNITFNCSFVTEGGEIMEGKVRNKFDQTGKMKVILE